MKKQGLAFVFLVSIPALGPRPVFAKHPFGLSLSKPCASASTNSARTQVWVREMVLFLESLSAT